MSDQRRRIVEITIDETSIVRWSPEVEHERNVAIFDLLESNDFHLRDGFEGPYRIHLSLRESTLILEVRNDELGEEVELRLPVRPLRRVIRDYFMICDSYFKAIRGASPKQIETIDMARRGLHNEGSEMLRDMLADRVEMDMDTARRLFTLVCVLHLRGR